MSGAPQPNHYGVIYADPPWTFATYSRKGKGRSPEAYYDCMSLDDIKALPVADWAADDSVLLLWTTDPLLPTAFDVIGAWGFKYKTVGFYWAKLNKSAPELIYDDTSFFTGLGFWTRANPELCLLATRGHPKRRRADVRKLIVSPRREHSRKPDEAYGRIEALCDGPYRGRAGTGGAPNPIGTTSGRAAGAPTAIPRHPRPRIKGPRSRLHERAALSLRAGNLLCHCEQSEAIPMTGT
jgi:N6-adenosine-specific RNA methylase IME4